MPSRKAQASPVVRRNAIPRLISFTKVLILAPGTFGQKVGGRQRPLHCAAADADQSGVRRGGREDKERTFARCHKRSRHGRARLGVHCQKHNIGTGILNQLGGRFDKIGADICSDVRCNRRARACCSRAKLGSL